MHIQTNISTLTPLQLMQRFYNDYNKGRPFLTVGNSVCKYARKKSNDTDKMTKFLLNQFENQRGLTSMTKSEYKKTLSIQKGTNTPNRYRSNGSDIQKRSYFKSIYSQSHPFLATDHKINEQNVNEIKGMKTQPIQPLPKNMFFDNSKLMNPTQNRKSHQEMKQIMIRIKQCKKQKMQKIRYNFIVNNSFKNHKQQTNPQIGLAFRIKKQQSNTKKRIFPTNPYLKL